MKKIPASCLLLGGGRGVRMGGNKLFLSVDGVPVIEPLLEKLAHIFDETIICAGHGEARIIFDAFGRVPVVEDRVAGRGPIEGLARGLEAMKHEWGFLFACDMPAPNAEVIRRMWSAILQDDCEIAAARIDGHVNAVHAFYRKTCLPHVEQAIAKARNLKIKAFYDCVKVKIIEEIFLESIPGYQESFSGYNDKNELRESVGSRYVIMGPK